jgi:hypothetical protein
VGEDVNGWDLYISRSDFCHNNFFIFFGLPAGDYTILIKAKGYQTIEQNYAIMPGIPKDFRATELAPE